jgi:hypothetical protein
MHEHHEVRCWTKHLGVSKEDLQKAVDRECRYGQKAIGRVGDEELASTTIPGVPEAYC